MQQARAAIWDLDGTLVDTAELHYAAWQALCRELGHELTRTDFHSTFGLRNPEILDYLFGPRHFTTREIEQLGLRKEELYRAAARNGVELLPGVRPLLEQLQSAGFRQAIGSSAPLANIDLILELTGTRQFFQAVASAEDTQRGKPDPQVFLVAAAKLGVEPIRCIVFEDAPAGVQAARNGGMKCIAVRFAGHHPEAALRTAGADLVVANLAELNVETIQRLLD